MVNNKVSVNEETVKPSESKDELKSDNKIKDTNSKEDSDDVSPIFEYRCGLRGWRPDMMQRFRNIYLFLAIMCLVLVVQSALSSGYMSSQITTLEKRFSLDSYMLGVIQCFFDVGFIVSVIFVGFLGGQGRIPTWIGVGMLVMSTGAFLFALPQLTSHYYHNATSGVDDSELCLATNSTAPVPNCKVQNRANWVVKLLFILGQVFIGCGSSPNLSLAPTYIDDHVSPALAPALIALLYASSALGPVIGFGLGAVMLQLPVTKNAFVNSKPGDPDWIGAWWGGYILFGSLAILISVFMFMFPKRVRKVKKVKMNNICNCCPRKSKGSKKRVQSIKRITPPPVQENNLKISQHLENELSTCTSEPSVQLSHETVANAYGKSIKDIPKAIVSLLCNKIYVTVSLAICFEMFLVNGFAAFLPKYIETEYKVSNIIASLIAGGLIVPAGSMGIIMGGVIMHRFQMSRRRAVLFSICAVLLVLVCMLLFFLFGCSNPLFAGLTKQIYYNGTMSSGISNNCSLDKCTNKCDPNKFLPLCDPAAKVSFFSACYAGCSGFGVNDTDKRTHRPKIFLNCSCTTTDPNSPGPTILNTGECSLSCNSLVTFCLFLTLALFLTGITQNPLLMVTMRSVEKHERSFSLGFQFVILRCLAYIPSPIIYGTVIDSSCLHWKYICEERGDCLITDLKLLNYYLIGLSFAVKCGAAVFYILLYFVVPKHVHIVVEGNISNTENILDDENSSEFL